MDHPGEELLTTYSIAPELVPGRAELEAHVRSCAACEAELADIRAFGALLADEASWPGEKPERAPAALRESAARRRQEDAEAEKLLQPLLDGPAPAFVWEDLPSKPKYYTVAVVRKLAAAADRMSYTNPRYALSVAKTASVLAGMLPASRYTPEELAAAKGMAWKQQANALRHLGRPLKAREALDRAQIWFEQLPSSELDLASIEYIRATTYTQQQDYQIAERHAAESTAAFLRLGQTGLYLGSRLLEGYIALENRDLARAQEIFETVYGYGEANGDATWTATGALALGHCLLERGDAANAERFLQSSLLLFRDLGITSAEVRCRWGLALVARRGGRPRIAVSRLRSVRNELLALGAATDAALVSLDLMETLLELGKPRDVQSAARDVVELFKEHGMLTGALTAADYLKQASAMRSLTPGIIDYVRKYLRRVAEEPDFEFVAPVSL